MRVVAGLRVGLVGVALSMLPACMAARSGALTAQQIETLRIRQIVVESAVTDPAQQAAFAEVKGALTNRIAAGLGGRYAPADRSGYRLVVTVETASFPVKGAPRAGFETGLLSGHARLFDASGRNLTAYKVSSIRNGKGSGQVSILGMVAGAVIENAFPTDYADGVAASAANQLVSAIVTPG